MRGTWTSIASIVLASLACDANLGSLTPADTGSESDDSSSGDGDGDGEPFVCVAGELCPDGTRCANGLCAVECDGDPECATDEYCGLDGLCHSSMVPSCSSDQQCASTQTCANGVCVTGDGCDPYNYVQDGCASNAVCIDDYDRDEQGICYEMPLCAADQTCPTGLEGAVCNAGIIPSKDEICLVGMCTAVGHCPDQWSCVHFDNAVLGVCSDGGFASPCTIHAHCTSGTCVPLPGAGGGFCG